MKETGRTRYRRRRAARGLVALALLAGLAGCQAPVETPEVWPVTRAEASDYIETSRHDDAMAFMADVAGRSPHIDLQTFGTTHEGRRLVVAVAGGPQSSARTPLRVLIMASIHAGEVCGKEATLMLLRDIAQGRHENWSGRLELMVVPVYNADGNESIAMDNRPRQHGPLAGMGRRSNAPGLDLNRDHMKLESAEARALISLMVERDPHLVLDLHTTNGTRHGYLLTYAPPLNPNTDTRITSRLRDGLLPDVTRSLRADHGWDSYHYGNVPPADRDMARGWYTFDHRPRFSNNYVGLRNRFAILSEAYSYATFRRRVETTLQFVESVLDHAAVHADELRTITEAVDRTSVVGLSLALRATLQASQQPVEILLGEVTEEINPRSGLPMLRRTDSVRREMMTEYVSFTAAETEIAPAVYLIPAERTEVVGLLNLHGIRFTRLAVDVVMTIESFIIESSVQDENEFQGRRQRTVTGRWAPWTTAIPAGTVIVPVDQPLGRLAFSLLEPRSDDGLLNWGLLGDDEEDPANGSYPIRRSSQAPPAPLPLQRR